MKKYVKSLSIILLLTVTCLFVACGKKESIQVSEVTHATSSELIGTWKGTGNMEAYREHFQGS